MYLIPRTSTPNSQLCITLKRPRKTPGLGFEEPKPWKLQLPSGQGIKRRFPQEQDTAAAAGSRSSASPASLSRQYSALVSSPPELSFPILPSSFLWPGPHLQILHRHQLVQHSLHVHRPCKSRTKVSTGPRSPWSSGRGGEALPAPACGGPAPSSCVWGRRWRLCWGPRSFCGLPWCVARPYPLRGPHYPRDQSDNPHRAGCVEPCSFLSSLFATKPLRASAYTLQEDLVTIPA